MIQVSRKVMAAWQLQNMAKEILCMRALFFFGSCLQVFPALTG